MPNGFWFGGIHCGQYGLTVEKYPALRGQTRRRSITSVSGRNGDLRTPDGSFSNSNAVYSCYFHGHAPTPEQTHQIRAWLMGTSGYQRLEDVYDPQYFRLAAFDGPLDVDNILNEYGRCQITFDCKPQCWLKSGEQPISIKESGTCLLNPTLFPAKPLITVHGTDAGKLMIGKYAVSFLEAPESIILDSEIQNAYSLTEDGTAVSKNNAIYAMPFPELVAGESLVTWDGGITGVEIIPRWWQL